MSALALARALYEKVPEHVRRPWEEVIPGDPFSRRSVPWDELEAETREEFAVLAARVEARAREIEA